MTTALADILKAYIAGLSFVDRMAGLVRVIIFTIQTGEDVNSKPATKRCIIPVGCDVSEKDCTDGRYSDLVPNSDKKSIIYFEEAGGSQMLGREGNRINFRSNLRMVGWLNLDKLGATDCSITPAVVASIIGSLPFSPVNNGVFTRLKVTNVQEAEKSSAIFSKYSYDEPVTQYLLYPYDYFALNITVEYSISKDCITAFTPGDEIKC